MGYLKQEKMSKSKAHIRYKNKDGKGIPGVTTVLSVLSKPALIPWANKLGLQGIDVSKYVDDKADIGTLAHYLIMCHLKGENPDTSDYSSNQIDQAENSMLSYLEWEKYHPHKPVLIEMPFVSEEYQYGGTLDLFTQMDNGEHYFDLVDFKTGKGIYFEMIVQLAGYRQLLNENGYHVHKTRILRIGRDESEGFEEKVITNLDNEWKIFWHCLQIYNLQKQMRK